MEANVPVIETIFIFLVSALGSSGIVSVTYTSTLALSRVLWQIMTGQASSLA